VTCSNLCLQRITKLLNGRMDLRKVRVEMISLVGRCRRKVTVFCSVVAIMAGVFFYNWALLVYGNTIKF
jgi:hypothetical protein